MEQVTHEGQNNTKSVYALNQGRVIEANEYYRSTASDPYMLVLKTNYSYNGNGRVITQRAEYESGQAEIVNYTYNTGLVRVTYSDENNGMPGAAYRVDSLKYSNNDLLTEGSLWFSDMDGYFMEGRTNFSYNAQNKLASILADEWGTTEEFSVEWQGTTCSIYSEPAHDLEVTVEFADQTSNLALLQPEALLFSSAFPYWFTDMARF